MKNILKQRAHNTKSIVLKATFLSVCMFLVNGCAEVDSDDGQVSNSLNLPVDSALTLFCPDAGIANEPCVLDDPNNPYATVPISDANKFQLSDDAPSAKARFYLWATAQAVSPRGENQYNVAFALHEMFDLSGSEIARNQALRAYRSVLDNYFNAVTFFGPFLVNGEEVFTPAPVRRLVGENMYAPGTVGNIFDNNDGPNQTLALQQFGEWGFTYDPGTGDFSRNF